jgi:hypothetical protein
VLFPDWAGLAAGDLLSGSEFPPSLLKNSQSQDKSARIIPYKDVFNRGRQIALIPHPERLTAKTSSGRRRREVRMRRDFLSGRGQNVLSMKVNMVRPAFHGTSRCLWVNGDTGRPLLEAGSWTLRKMP